MTADNQQGKPPFKPFEYNQQQPPTSSPHDLTPAFLRIIAGVNREQPGTTPQVLRVLTDPTPFQEATSLSLVDPKPHFDTQDGTKHWRISPDSLQRFSETGKFMSLNVIFRTLPPEAHGADTLELTTDEGNRYVIKKSENSNGFPQFRIIINDQEQILQDVPGLFVKMDSDGTPRVNLAFPKKGTVADYKAGIVLAGQEMSISEITDLKNLKIYSQANKDKSKSAPEDLRRESAINRLTQLLAEPAITDNNQEIQRLLADIPYGIISLKEVSDRRPKDTRIKLVFTNGALIINTDNSVNSASDEANLDDNNNVLSHDSNLLDDLILVIFTDPKNPKHKNIYIGFIEPESTQQTEKVLENAYKGTIPGKDSRIPFTSILVEGYASPYGDDRGTRDRKFFRGSDIVDYGNEPYTYLDSIAGRPKIPTRVFSFP